jgi:hypothetical protein
MRLQHEAAGRAALTAKRQAQYCFSILSIDDKPRIGLESLYRITMCQIKEIDMNRFANHAFAALAAFALTLGSIGAIVTVPAAQAATPTPDAFAATELA